LLFEGLTLDLVLRGLAVCAAGGLVGFAIGGAAGLGAVALSPEEFEWQTMFGVRHWRSTQAAFTEMWRDCSWAGAFLGLLITFVLAQVINHARLIREAQEKPAETWQATQEQNAPAMHNPDHTGIMEPRDPLREGYREGLDDQG
jgi:hypothetical protein